MRLEQFREEIAGAKCVRFPARPGARYAELPRDRGALLRSRSFKESLPKCTPPKKVCHFNSARNSAKAHACLAEKPFCDAARLARRRV